SESIVSANIGLRSLSEVNFNWLPPTMNCPPPIGTRRPPLQRETLFSITNLAGERRRRLPGRQRVRRKMVRASQLIASHRRHVRGRIKEANKIFTLRAPRTLAQMLDSHQGAQLLRRSGRQ